ncbi:ArsR/SmtB family transcription factor [Paenalcaligenes hominis]|uniref:ArsR/SmtB family transcription factor n=1 Tax=Paenalcaligenes hominis TaxID=643674 RepID=UPI0035256392
MDKKEAVSKFDALASELRLDIVKLLVQFGEDGLVAGEISSQLAIPPTNLSFHLKTLTHAGLVYVEQEGRFQRYRANTSALVDLVGYLMAECCEKQTNPKTGMC